MKTFYQNPDMEIVKFVAEDVISTSGDNSDIVDNENMGDLH